MRKNVAKLMNTLKSDPDRYRGMNARLLGFKFGVDSATANYVMDRLGIERSNRVTHDGKYERATVLFQRIVGGELPEYSWLPVDTISKAFGFTLTTGQLGAKRAGYKRNTPPPKIKRAGWKGHVVAKKAKSDPELYTKTYLYLAKKYKVSVPTIKRIIVMLGIKRDDNKIANAARKAADCRKANIADDELIFGELLRDDEYFKHITHRRALGVALTGDYWKRYREMLQHKINEEEDKTIESLWL